MSREQLEEEFLNKAKRNKSFKQAVGGRRSSIKEELARNCEVGKFSKSSYTFCRTLLRAAGA